MRKLWLTMLCTLAFLGTAAVSEAKIFVNISDGTTTLNAQAATAPVPFTRGNLVLSKLSPAPTGTLDATDTLNILSCAAPCAVGFPSGTINGAQGDTFLIQDVALNNRARVTKLDSGTSSDRVSLSGVKITSRLPSTGTYTPKVLTITYGTQNLDLRALTPTQAASYFVSAAFSGSFKSGATKASACKQGTATTDMDDASDACLRLSVAMNGTSVDGQGNTVSATVAVACSNAFPTLNPCGTNGSWTPSLGTFTGVNDGRSLSCPSACSPSQVATLTAKFNGANEVLQLTASLNGVISNVMDQDGGVEEAAIALADEVSLNRWVTTSTNELCRAVPKAPTTNDTRNITNKSSLPVSFEYWCGQYAPAGEAGVPLVSLADSGLIPGAAGAKYMASRETFLPAPGTLQFKAIQTLTLKYLVATDREQSPTDTRLDSLVHYSDCVDGSIRLEIQLVDGSGVDKGTMKVYLGNDPNNNYKTNGCQAFAASFPGGNVDIRNNPDARVDASGIAVNNPPACCVTFGSLQNGTIGNLFVRRAGLIVDRGLSGDLEGLNFKVTFFSGVVNAFTVSGVPPTPPSVLHTLLQVVTNVVRVTPTSTNGVYIVVSKLDPANPNAPPLFTKVIPSTQGPETIVIIGGKFTTSVNVQDLQAVSGAPFAISLCPNGVTNGVVPLPDNPNPVMGICIPDNARFTFQ
jgi:hypothetical protein